MADHNDPPAETDSIAVGPSRRSLIAGAAWAVPAIALATATPALAATAPTITLSFDRSSYSGTACSSVVNISVAVHRGGDPVVGVSVTVSLSGGYTFSDGSVTATLVTDTAGTCAVPSVTVPTQGGTATLTASSAGATSASAAIFESPVLNGTPGYFDAQTTYLSTTGIPNNSLPVFGTWFLTPNHDLIIASTGQLIASNVARVGPADDRTVGLVTTTGRAGYFDDNMDFHWAIGVPNNSTPVFGTWFLTQNGDLIRAFNGQLIGEIVDKVGQPDGKFVGLVNTKGQAGFFDDNTDFRFATGVPDHSVPVFGTWFLTQNGDLIRGTDGKLIGEIVATVGPSNGKWVGLVNNLGQAGYFNDVTQFQYATGVPDHSTPVLGTWFISPDGDLIRGTDGQVLRANVKTVGRASEAGAGIADRPVC